MSFFNSISPMYTTIIILITAVGCFVSGKIKSDIVAMYVLMALVLTNVLTPNEALADFSNPIVMMMIGLFMIGSAILKTGLANIIGNQILRFSGTSENNVFIAIMLVTSIIGGFLSSTGTVAIMMPIVLSICANANLNPKRFLIPMAYASSLGLLTLICVPQNLIIQSVIINAGYPALSFFSFAPVGLTCMFLGITSSLFLSKILTKNSIETTTKKDKNKKLLNELISKYELGNKVYKIIVPKNSSFIGKTLNDLNFCLNFNVTINKIVYETKATKITKEVKDNMATYNTTIKKGSVLYCQGLKEDVEAFLKETDFSFPVEKKNKTDNIFDFRTVGIAEIFILPHSPLIGQTVADINFRENYKVKVLAIKQEDGVKSLIKDIRNASLQFGDSLLVEGDWKDLDNLYKKEKDFVLLGRPLKEASKLIYNEKAPITGLIMLLMILSMVFEIFPPVISVIFAVLTLLATRCLRSVEESYQSVNWQTIVVMAGMLPMARAFEKTGLTELIAFNLINSLGGMGPYALLVSIYILGSILTTFISSSASAVLTAPIALKGALLMGVSPYPFLLATTVSTTMAFISPFSTSQNLLVMSVGRYKFMDYVKAGLPMQLLIGISMIFALPIFYPF